MKEQSCDPAGEQEQTVATPHVFTGSSLSGRTEEPSPAPLCPHEYRQNTEKGNGGAWYARILCSYHDRGECLPRLPGPMLWLTSHPVIQLCPRLQAEPMTTLWHGMARRCVEPKRVSKRVSHQRRAMLLHMRMEEKTNEIPVAPFLLPRLPAASQRVVSPCRLRTLLRSLFALVRARSLGLCTLSPVATIAQYPDHGRFAPSSHGGCFQMAEPTISCLLST